MKIFYVLLTAITVSVDSFLCGLSLSLKNKNKLAIILGISSVVCLLCFVATFFGNLFENFLKSKTEVFGGLILIIISVYNFFSSEKEQKEQKSILKYSLFVGFAIGIDGACASFSLAVMGYNSILIPLVFTFFHLVFISFSFIVSKNKFLKRIAQNRYISPLLLFSLGVYKIVSCLL